MLGSRAYRLLCVAFATAVVLAVLPATAFAVSSPGFGTEIECLAISPNFAADKTIFVGGLYDATFWRSTNGGTSFSLIPGAPQGIEDIAVSPAYATDRMLFAASGGNRFGVGKGIYRSTNGGTTWTRMMAGLPAEGIPYRFRISPGFATDRTIVAMVNTDLYKSTDAGVSWTKITPPDDYGLMVVQNFDMSPEFVTDGGLVIVEGFGDGIAYSTTGGASWNRSTIAAPWTQGFMDVCYSSGFTSDGTIIATQDGRTFRSTNRGATFDKIADEWGVLPARAVVTSPLFATDRTVLAGSARSVSAGVEPGWLMGRSTDGGQTWAKSETGLGGSWIEDIDYSPNFSADRTVYAVIGESYQQSTGGVFVSRNGGATWTRCGGTKAVMGTPAVSPSSPRRRSAFYVSGTLPAHTFSTSLQLLFYQRNSRGVYVRRRIVTVGVAGGVGTYRARILPLLSAGKWYVRSYHSDPSHDPSYSTIRYFTVRN